jgi:hypothetical protein
MVETFIVTSQYRNCNFTKITIETIQFVTENVEKVAASGPHAGKGERGARLGARSTTTLASSTCRWRRAWSGERRGTASELARAPPRAALPAAWLSNAALSLHHHIPARVARLSPRARGTPPPPCGSRRHGRPRRRGSTGSDGGARFLRSAR